MMMNPAFAAQWQQNPSAITDLLDDFSTLLDTEWKLLLCLAVILVTLMYGSASAIVVRHHPRPHGHALPQARPSTAPLLALPSPRPRTDTDMDEQLSRALGLVPELRPERLRLCGRVDLPDRAAALALVAVAQPLRALGVDEQVERAQAADAPMVAMAEEVRHEHAAQRVRSPHSVRADLRCGRARHHSHLSGLTVSDHLLPQASSLISVCLSS